MSPLKNVCPAEDGCDWTHIGGLITASSIPCKRIPGLPAQHHSGPEQTDVASLQILGDRPAGECVNSSDLAPIVQSCGT